MSVTFLSNIYLHLVNEAHWCFPLFAGCLAALLYIEIPFTGLLKQKNKKKLKFGDSRSLQSEKNNV